MSKTNRKLSADQIRDQIDSPITREGKKLKKSHERLPSLDEIDRQIESIKSGKAVVCSSELTAKALEARRAAAIKKIEGSKASQYRT